MRGKFITFEGGEGAGKSTQARLLAERLQARGIGVLLTREPGGSSGAEIIRHVLLSGAAKPLGAEVEAVLFAAARADHVDHAIRPALQGGRWVVCDRFIDSTRVYQGALGQVDAGVLRGLERVTVGDAMPDLTIILDLAPALGLERAASRRGTARADRFETEGVEFHEKLRAAYREVAARDPGRCVLVAADGTADMIAAEVWNAVSTRLRPAVVEVMRGAAVL